MNPPKEVKVTVSMTLSKTMKIMTQDYDIDVIGMDEENYPIEKADFSKCGLKTAVSLQKILPNSAYTCVDVYDDMSAKVYEDLKGWHVDDFEVIPNE